MVNMKKGVVCPLHLVSLSRIQELKAVEQTDGKLRIGACYTVSELAGCSDVGKSWSALVHAAGALGTPLIRNPATVGGNIASARPAADLPPPLIAYEAKELFKGPGRTILEPGEILTEILIEMPQPGSGAGYINLGVRKAQDCNIVNVASFIALDSDGTLKSARIVLGSVGTTPIRAPSAEKILIGQRPSEKLFEKAGEAASRDSTPILDFRGSAEYRRAMTAFLTKRTLTLALREANR